MTPSKLTSSTLAFGSGYSGFQVRVSVQSLLTVGLSLQPLSLRVYHKSEINLPPVNSKLTGTS